MEKKGYLLLENGRLFEGVLHGAQTEAKAELVFTTGVVGYMENITDPSYAGQILVQTFPCVGCYGVVPLDDEHPRAYLAGYVVRELTEEPSNFRMIGKLDDYLRDNGVTCLSGVDTRAITRCLRDNGTMKGAILTEKPADLAAAAKALKSLSHAPVAAGCEEVVPAQGKGLNHVVLWDFGTTSYLKNELEARNCSVTCVPCTSTAAQIMELNPDGVVIAGGAGCPEDHFNAIAEVANLCARRVPVMGIGLGHQLLALSQRAAVVKLPYGHRGGNQPLKDVLTGLNYISNQNHGYAVDNDSLPEHATLRFINCNDGTCEGIDYTSMPAFSVQFMPEPCGGPLDTRFLFERFIALMGGNKECR